MTNPPTIAVFFILFFFFQLLFTIHVTSYKPVDHFTVNCGTSGNILSLDQRNWTGDVGSTLFSLVDPNNGTQPIEAQPRIIDTIPYGTARLSRSEFSYSFPVTDGQKFVRLYFYPSSYHNFLRSDSLFSVKAGPHTLLKDFNASLHADAATSRNADAPAGTIFREYCINVDPGQRLIITFTPSLSHPNAYAFVNGIEVVSMPAYLYYTNPDNLQAMLLNDRTQQFPVRNNSALETMYRTNVGGSQIPREDDTGMFRYWDQDVEYLEKKRPYSISVGFGLKLDYKHYPNYTATDAVYLTARNYGMKETSKFNVTWDFQVDSKFIYMVRLHFCEFDENIQNVGERVFQIFIGDYLVEPLADVMIWTGHLVPVHRDYAVWMQSEGSQKKMNISIKLQPHPTARSVYRDVLLNGIEILKINDYNDNLGGPNPDPRPSTSLPSMPPSSSSTNTKETRLIFIIVGATSCLVALSLIILLILRRLNRAQVNEGSSWWGQKSVTTLKTSKSRGSLLSFDSCRCFSVAHGGNERPSMGDVMLGLESEKETLKKAEEKDLWGDAS